jgi:O-antigen biosynthesis protein
MQIPVERLSENAWMPPWVRHEHYARYEWAAGLTVGGTVVDAACGSGYGARVLLRGGAAHVDGFDIAPDAIAEANNRHAGAGSRFQQADVTQLPTPDHAYDFFLSFETMEHVDNDIGLLREAVRVLKPGGTFMCSMPNRRVTNPGVPITSKPYNSFHVREYTQEELEPVLREFFPVVSFFGQSFHGHGYVGALNRLGRCWPALAMRTHQVRKVLGLPWETRDLHWPSPLPARGEPEIMVAVCRL